MHRCFRSFVRRFGLLQLQRSSGAGPPGANGNRLGLNGVKGDGAGAGRGVLVGELVGAGDGAGRGEGFGAARPPGAGTVGENGDGGANGDGASGENGSGLTTGFGTVARGARGFGVVRGRTRSPPSVS